VILPLLKRHRLTFFVLAFVIAGILFIAFQARMHRSPAMQGNSTEMVD